MSGVVHVIHKINGIYLWVPKTGTIPAELQSSWEQFEKHKEHSVDRQAPPRPISYAPHWSQPPQQPPTCVLSIHSYLALNDKYDPSKRLETTRSAA